MKRFYTSVGVDETDGLFHIHLDARPIKTALGNPQSLPTRALAEAMAEEWSAQDEEIDPALFRYRDLADFALDMVDPDPDATITKLLSFIETDTLCYRADPDDHLYRRQQEVWEPILTAFEAREGVTLERISGIMHQPQAPATHEALSNRLATLDSFALTSLLTMTSLAASLIVGLSALAEDAEPEGLWRAANLEEDWQIEQWGQDPEAEAVSAKRRADFLNAWTFGQLAAG